MDEEIWDLLSRLKQAPLRRIRHTLVRCVELGSLMENSKPDFLFTSGKRDRYNLDGVECIYFAQDEETARAEHRCQDHPAQSFRPVCMFFADASLNILDLTLRSVRKALDLTEKDLRAPWERVRHPTRTQLLGTAVNKQGKFAGIRYPSDAARAHGFRGHNVVIFRACVRRPSFVRVLGEHKRRLQSWP
ncbi:MAG TPA: RES family NAD+ phosphorylase [Verrucomicrobiae bacterium]|nr:RES family NAD+ phosphorylase [Verrucomicrobiae bacterium]